MASRTGLVGGVYGGLNVLVTGADGFIGSHLSEHLFALGANVTALCLYNASGRCGWLDTTPPAVRRRLTIVQGDVRDAAFVRRLVAERDMVFHLAALTATSQSYVAAQSYVDTNITGTLNVLEAAREHGVGRVVHASTCEVYASAAGVPIGEQHPLQGRSPAAASRIGADMLAQAFAQSFELPLAILRPFDTFGPRQSERAVIPTVIRQALDPAVPSIAVRDLRPIRDFTFVGDIVTAFLALGAAREVELGRVYNAGSGRRLRISEVVETVRRLAGTDKSVITEAAPARPSRSEVAELVADATALARLTGWRPQVSLEDGLARTVAWWRCRLGAPQIRPEANYAT